MGITARAHMSSIALLMATGNYSAESSNIPTAGAASPLCEVALGFNSPVGGGRPTTFSAPRKVRGGRYSSNSAPKVP